VIDPAAPSRPPGPPPALQLDGLGQRFGLTTVLRGLDLAVLPGERLAVIGPNGAGKTTLFNLLSGRQRPTAGRVWLHGRRIDGLPPWRIARLGLARSFQVGQLFGSLTVRENLEAALLGAVGPRYAFWRRLGRLHALRARAEALLAQLGLAHRAAVAAGTLSYAEQRALELGLAVAVLPPPEAGLPRVLLLDEPTAGLSRHETEALVPLIRRLSEGATLLLVEHDMGVVFGLADRIAVLVQGELLALDTPERVRADARVQAAYLGGLASADSEGARPC